jgi:hypothetical protein
MLDLLTPPQARHKRATHLIPLPCHCFQLPTQICSFELPVGHSSLLAAQQLHQLPLICMR